MMVHRVLYEVAGQSLVHVPVERVTSATYVIEDLEKDPDDSDRTLASGSASLDSMSLTTTAVAGYTQADPRRMSVSDTTGAVAGKHAVIVSADGAYEAFVVEEVASGSYIKAAHPLVGTYETGSTVYGVEMSAPVPAGVYDDEERVEQHDSLRVVWSYSLRGVPTKAQEQIRVVRESVGDADLATVRHMIENTYPLLANSLPNGDARQLDRWVSMAQRLVYGHLRRKQVRPELLLGGDNLNDAIMYRALVLAAENQAVPAANDPESFREQMETRYTEVFDGMMTGLPGEETAELDPVAHTATDGASKTIHRKILGW